MNPMLNNSRISDEGIRLLSNIEKGSSMNHEILKQIKTLDPRLFDILGVIVDFELKTVIDTYLKKMEYCDKMKAVITKNKDILIAARESLNKSESDLRKKEIQLEKREDDLRKNTEMKYQMTVMSNDLKNFIAEDKIYKMTRANRRKKSRHHVDPHVEVKKNFKRCKCLKKNGQRCKINTSNINLICEKHINCEDLKFISEDSTLSPVETDHDDLFFANSSAINTLLSLNTE